MIFPKISLPIKNYTKCNFIIIRPIPLCSITLHPYDHKSSSKTQNYFSLNKKDVKKKIFHKTSREKKKNDDKIHLTRDESIPYSISNIFRIHNLIIWCCIICCWQKQSHILNDRFLFLMKYRKKYWKRQTNNLFDCLGEWLEIHSSMTFSEREEFFEILKLELFE